MIFLTLRRVGGRNAEERLIVMVTLLLYDVGGDVKAKDKEDGGFALISF